MRFYYPPAKTMYVFLTETEDSTQTIYRPVSAVSLGVTRKKSKVRKGNSPLVKEFNRVMNRKL